MRISMWTDKNEITIWERENGQIGIQIDGTVANLNPEEFDFFVEMSKFFKEVI